MNGAKWKYFSKQSPFVTFDDAFVEFCMHLLVHYDKESNNCSNWVRQGDESESGQKALKKVKKNLHMLIYIYDS